MGLACAAILLTAGCSRRVAPPALVVVEHEISPAPARVGPATIGFKLIDAAGKPITGGRIAVEADMSHAGMGPVFANAKEEGDGVYKANLEFQMAGDWVLLLHITLPGGEKVERQIDVAGVRRN